MWPPQSSRFLCLRPHPRGLLSRVAAEGRWFLSYPTAGSALRPLSLLWPASSSPGFLLAPQPFLGPCLPSEPSLGPRSCWWGSSRHHLVLPSSRATPVLLPPQQHTVVCTALWPRPNHTVVLERGWGRHRRGLAPGGHPGEATQKTSGPSCVVGGGGGVLGALEMAPLNFPGRPQEYGLPEVLG